MARIGHDRREFVGRAFCLTLGAGVAASGLGAQAQTPPRPIRRSERLLRAGESHRTHTARDPMVGKALLDQMSQMYLGKTPSTNVYASADSESRRGRVVHDRLSQSRGSRATSRDTTVPLPAPPGPETTRIRTLRCATAAGVCSRP